MSQFALKLDASLLCQFSVVSEARREHCWLSVSRCLLQVFERAAVSDFPLFEWSFLARLAQSDVPLPCHCVAFLMQLELWESCRGIVTVTREGDDDTTVVTVAVRAHRRVIVFLNRHASVGQ